MKELRRALARGEVAIAAPILLEVLSGIRDRQEFEVREADFRALPQIQVDGEAGDIAARIGRRLAEIGKMAKTVDLLLAGAAIRANTELWSLPDDHYRELEALLKRSEIEGTGVSKKFAGCRTTDVVAPGGGFRH